MRRAWVVLGLLLFLLTAPRVRGEDVDVARLVSDLGSTEGTRRTSAWQTLQRVKDERAIPLLLDAIPELDFWGRYYAELVLESYAPAVAARPLRTLLHSTDPYLELAAGAFFLRRGEAGGVEAVLEALGKPGLDLQTRTTMVNRLSGIADPRVRQALVSWISRGTEPSLLGSVLLLFQNEEVPAALDACRRLLAGTVPPDARLLASSFLYRFGDEECKSAIAEIFREEAITTISIYRVKTLFQAAPHVAPEILDGVTRRLQNESQPFLLTALIQIVADAGYAKALGTLRKLSVHEDANVSRAALEALLRMGGTLDPEALRSGLAAKDALRRLDAADLLRRMDDLSGLPVVVAVLEKGTPSQRLRAASLLGGFRHRDAVAPLLDALDDEDAPVRSAALRSLDVLFQCLFPYRRLDLVAAGYDAAAGPAERREAVRRIRAWWEGHQGGGW